MIVGCYTGIVVSIGFIFFYGFQNIFFMQMINLLGIGIFTTSIFLFKRGCATVPFLIATVYILMGCISATHYIGIESNFHIFALILIPFAFVNPFWNKLEMLLYI